MNRKLIIGISGASGFIYGVRLLQVLQQSEIETHLILTQASQLTRSHETDLSADDIKQLADKVHSNNDLASSLASGSFKTCGMIIAPCSMRTLADIACGTTNHLISRAADVTLKERRRLVLLARETPLHLGHLDNMKKVTQIGAIIAPPVPAFYNKPQSIDDIINHSVGRVLDLFDIELDLVKRWGQD